MSANRWYIVVVDDVSKELGECLNSSTDRAILFNHLPFLLVLSDKKRTTMMARLPGIRSVQPIDKGRMKIIIGIERLLKDGIRAVSTLQTNGWDEDKYSNENYKKIVEASAYKEDKKSEDVLVFNYPDFFVGANGELISHLDFTTLLPTRLGLMAAINISAGPSDPFERYDPDEPVNLATYVASKSISVVMAAGNSGPAEFEHETMSAWAQAPWVISVGATDSEVGGKLCQWSSVGSPDSPFSGPTVVAYGRSDIQPFPWGTSFAAPRVSRALRLLAAYCLTLRYFVHAEKKLQPIEGIPLVGYGMIDDDQLATFWQRSQKLPALPRKGIDTNALSKILSVLDNKGIKPEIWPSPERLRQMLILSAQPMPGYESYQVGHGFISDETVRSFLEKFTGADFATLFCPDLGNQTILLDELKNYQLTQREYLPFLIDIWRESSRSWFSGIYDNSYFVYIEIDSQVYGFTLDDIINIPASNEVIPNIISLE